jgi:hypothetical protein
MKAAPLVAALVTLAALATFSHEVKADENVRACIAASTEGQTLRRQGKLLAAREQMIACARDACPGIVRSSCARWLAEVDATVPSVVVRAENAAGEDVIGATFTIDGRAKRLDGQPVRLDPGEHVVVVVDSAGTGVRKEMRVLLAEGEKTRLVTLRFASPVRVDASTTTPTATTTSPAPSHARAVPAGAWVLGGAGIVALGAATYFGVTASHDLSDLQSTCSPHCTDAQAQPGRTNAALFDVFLAAGGAAVAGAIVWGLAFPSHASASTSASASTYSTARARLEVRPLLGIAMTGLSVSY